MDRYVDRAEHYTGLLSLHQGSIHVDQFLFHKELKMNLTTMEWSTYNNHNMNWIHGHWY